ncbi:MAG: SDR family NAD(P)-dependent oxidoreductase [Ardenticatenales bacterium]|nr:SDR family NAD(P)-dependent oxidoreductase [Ardenticatenales bacterium]
MTAYPILVTGAAGFIGSHLAESLLSRGDAVIGLDNLNDYYDPARKRANLAELCTDSSCAERFTFIEGDVRDRSLLAALFERYRPQAIAHLAAMAGVRASIDDPHLYYEVNLTGSLNLLEEARQQPNTNFVFASTSSAYGNTDRTPFEETDKSDRPLSPYPASKRAAELLGHSFHHLFDQNFTALRFFTVYGPRGRPDMMAYKVLDNIFFGRDVPLYNNGQMYRDWTYVEDIVAGIVAALDRPLGYEIINLGRGEPVLLADFVARIEALSGHSSSLRPAPMMNADIRATHAEISKARRLLDYNPTISVQEGVERFWTWYRSAVLED